MQHPQFESTMTSPSGADTPKSLPENKSPLASDNPQLLWTLGQIYRSRGALDRAAETFRQLVKLDPDDTRANYLHAILNEQLLPEVTSVDGIWPAPFVRIENFLPQTVHDNLLDSVLTHRDGFVASKTSAGLKPDRRASWMLSEIKAFDIDSEVVTRIEANLPEVLLRLQIAPFPFKIDRQITSHLDGHFYRVHQDNSSQANHDRQISCVYYFHRIPKRFTGGDLRLYDTDLRQNRYAAAQYTRIQPIDNSIIFFPSGYFHEVTEVVCETNHFDDGRFTLNSWLTYNNDAVRER